MSEAVKCTMWVQDTGVDGTKMLAAQLMDTFDQPATYRNGTDSMGRPISATWPVWLDEYSEEGRDRLAQKAREAWERKHPATTHAVPATKTEAAG